MNETLQDAIREALKFSSVWTGGSVVVRTAQGYYAMPAAHLRDTSYTGSRDVVCKIQSLADITGDGRGWHDLRHDEQDWCVAQVLEECK